MGSAVNPRALLPHIKGVLVLLHVLAISLMALPAPQGAMRRAAWKEATVQDEFSAWTERLYSVGYTTTPEELEEDLWDLGVRVTETRRRVLRPFQPYYRFLGTAQSWRMFVAPHRYPTRLHVELKRPGEEWETLSIFQDSEYRWKAEVFEQDRFRSCLFRYGWKNYGGARKLFNEWLAREAAEEFPDATHLRTRWYKYKTPTPEEARAGEEPEGRFILTNRLTLADHRKAE
jgi:hypothetical protein